MPVTVLPSPRLRLDEWSRAIPGIWRAVGRERDDWRPDSAAWPAPVFLPLERAGAATMAALAGAGERMPSGPGELSPAACTTQCLATWRMTQGIYRIDPTLYAALIDTPIAGDIPADVLLWLPEWCVYIETPGMTVPVARGEPVRVLGLWYWLDAAPGRDMILCIGIDIGRAPPIIVQHVPLVGTLEAAIGATMREWDDAFARGNARRPPPSGYREAAAAWLPPALSLALYLCSRNAEIAGSGRPGNPVPRSTRRGGVRMFAAEGTRLWDVGMRLGAALHAAARAREAGDGTGDGRRMIPHIRRAHWHTYVLGPRAENERRRRELRWLPPIPVAIEDYDALPAVIRPVRPKKAGSGDGDGNAS